MKKQLKIISLIFFLSLFVRLFFVFKTSYFSDDSAYFVLRQVEHILNTGFPLFSDSLSYGGRLYLFLPLFHYIIAFASLSIGPWLAAKILPNIFASSIVFVVYFLSLKLSRSEKAAVLSSFAAGFIPAYVEITLNTLSALSAAIPAGFFLLYLFLEAESKNNSKANKANQKKRAKKGSSKAAYQGLYASGTLFIAFFCVLLLLHASVIYFVLSFIIYMLMCYIENIKASRSQLELTIFSAFLTIFFYIVFFKRALLANGINVIWQNIPSEVIANYFNSISFIDTIYFIGIVPVIASLYVAYKKLFRTKSKAFYLLFSFSLIIVFLLLFRLVPFKPGLAYLGIVSSILLSEAIVIFLGFIEKTKLHKFLNIIVGAIVLIFVLSSVVPSIHIIKEQLSAVPDRELFIVLDVLRRDSSQGSVVVAPLSLGHKIAYFSKRANVIDSNFLMRNDIEKRLDDLSTIYRSAVDYKAIELMERYNASYLLFSDEAKKEFNISRISYISDSCFPVVFSKGRVVLYKRECSLAQDRSD